MLQTQFGRWHSISYIKCRDPSPMPIVKTADSPSFALVSLKCHILLKNIPNRIIGLKFMHFSKGKKNPVRDSEGLQEQIISLIIYCLEESIKLESAVGGRGERSKRATSLWSLGLHGMCQQQRKEQQDGRQGGEGTWCLSRTRVWDWLTRHLPCESISVIMFVTGWMV